MFEFIFFISIQEFFFREKTIKKIYGGKQFNFFSDEKRNKKNLGAKSIQKNSKQKLGDKIFWKENRINKNVGQKRNESFLLLQKVYSVFVLRIIMSFLHTKEKLCRFRSFFLHLCLFCFPKKIKFTSFLFS